MKREPTAANRQAAAAMHELYVAVIDEGFTERQAIALLGEMFKANQEDHDG